MTTKIYKPILLSITLILILISCSQPNNIETKIFTITYKTEHGTAPSKMQVKENTLLSKENLPILENDGYFFINWVDEDTNEVIKENYTVTKDITLKAAWEEAYTVIFTTAKGTAPNPIKNIRKNSTITLPSMDNIEQYHFYGWYEGENQITSDNYKVTKNVTLTARWEETFSLTYDTGCDLNVPSMTGLRKGFNVIPPSNLERKGYTFQGWLYNGSLVQNKVVIEKDTTLIASWLPVTYSITYENLVPIQGQAGVIEAFLTPKEYTIESDLINLYVPTTVTGAIFNGWYIDDNTKIQSIPKGSTGNITLKAKWTIDQEVPGPVTTLNGSYNKNTKEITLTCLLPSDEDIENVIVSYQIGESKTSLILDSSSVSKTIRDIEETMLPITFTVEIKDKANNYSEAKSIVINNQ